MNEVVEMSVSTPEQFIRALRLCQNIFAGRSVINVFNQRASFAKRVKIVDDIQSGVTSIYKSTTGSFAAAQLSQYSHLRLFRTRLGDSLKLLLIRNISAVLRNLMILSVCQQKLQSCLTGK